MTHIPFLLDGAALDTTTILQEIWETREHVKQDNQASVNIIQNVETVGQMTKFPLYLQDKKMYT